MILLDNCERQLFANAGFSFGADCKDVDSVHDFERERRRALRRALAALRACGLSLRRGGLPLLCWWLGTFMIETTIQNGGPGNGACNNCLQSLEAVVVHLAMASAKHVAPFAHATTLQLPDARGSKREGVDGCF